MEHAEYSADMIAIGFEQELSTIEGGKANYRVEIVEAGYDGFRAVAEAVKDFDGDGVFSRWEIDQNMNLVEIAKD
jgi:type IV pilus assembly protein PilE